MRTFSHTWPALAMVGLFYLPATAQQQTPPPPPAPPAPSAPAAASKPAPDPKAVAATVNGQAIPELAVYRAIKHVPPDVPPEQQAQLRQEIIDHLVDKTLVDQHLAQFRIAVTDEEVDGKLKMMREEMQKQGRSFDKLIKEMLLTEAELRTEIAGELRWEKFVNQQATDKLLQELFDKQREVFDGTTVRARHILLTPPAKDAKASEQTRVRLLEMKKQIEATVAQGLAKLPATADNLTRERERAKLTEEAFADLAKKESTCPSKANGGDVNFFPRAGAMVESFAQAAFALKPHQMSDVVTTDFGHHLILVTDRKPGKPIKFEDAKEGVKEFYAEQLREEIVAKLRSSAKITITPQK